MITATITVTLHSHDTVILDGLIHGIDLITLPPSGREDWTREIKVNKEEL